jgi:hypothetical protein
MTNANWTGVAVAALAGLSLACSGPRAEEREPTPDKGLPGDSTVGQSSATGAPTARSAPQAPVEALPMISGRVTGAEGSQLRIQPEGRSEETLLVDPAQTAIAIDGREGTLNELTPGTEVRAAYEESQGTKKAVTVQARTGERQHGPDVTEPGDPHHGTSSGVTSTPQH